VQGGTAHRAPGLGRQNCKQRLEEYAAERGAVLGFAASAAASGAVGGRTKRARGVGVGGPGGPDSDETDEDGMGTDSDEIDEDEEEDVDVDALAARVTIVFEGGRSGALPGYVLVPRSPSPRTVLTRISPECRFKYEPDALRAAVLHPRRLLSPVDPTTPRMRKRQRVDDEGDDDAMDTEVDGANTDVAPIWRGVELETAVERFLLRMYEADVEPDAESKANATSEDAEGYAEKMNTSAEDEQQQRQGGRVYDRRRWEIWLLGTLDEKDGPRRLPPPSSVDENTVKAVGGAVLLQRGLRASNLEFVEGEVRVLQDAPAIAADSESSSGAREGWAIEVRQWRWARSR